MMVFPFHPSPSASQTPFHIPVKYYSLHILYNSTLIRSKVASLLNRVVEVHAHDPQVNLQRLADLVRVLHPLAALVGHLVDSGVLLRAFGDELVDLLVLHHENIVVALVVQAELVGFHVVDLPGQLGLTLVEFGDQIHDLPVALLDILLKNLDLFDRSVLHTLALAL